MRPGGYGSGLEEVSAEAVTVIEVRIYLRTY